VRANDAVSGLVLILLAGLMIYLTLGFPAFPGQKYGPSLAPRILGAGIILCGVLLILRGWTARRSGEAWVSFAPWVREPWRVISFLLVPALVVLYILLSETIGFLPVAFALLLILFLWFRVRPLAAPPIAFISVFAINYFFGHLMRVPLPRGLLNHIELPQWLMSIL
jgi:putative tricarboxylic transport membrane protein